MRFRVVKMDLFRETAGVLGHDRRVSNGYADPVK
tara:strand:- start:1071 stop:1172 length:102 start_codon:yes stop_codon:yes gene_type:complete